MLVRLYTHDSIDDMYQMAEQYMDDGQTLTEESIIESPIEEDYNDAGSDRQLDSHSKENNGEGSKKVESQVKEDVEKINDSPPEENEDISLDIEDDEGVINNEVLVNEEEDSWAEMKDLIFDLSSIPESSIISEPNYDDLDRPEWSTILIETHKSFLSSGSAKVGYRIIFYSCPDFILNHREMLARLYTHDSIDDMYQMVRRNEYRKFVHEVLI
uniref:DBD_Tnp_Mut domain-containing protein n=1 Tax=Rhabditophanes sp. KR3021 TaxID=114890 RepID=A0AC35TUL6_9BILA